LLRSSGRLFWKKRSALTETGLNRFQRVTAAKIVIDAYAWIEFFIGSEKGRRVKEIIEDADEVYTPGTVLAEIARKYLREGVDDETVDARLESISAASNIVHIDPELASEAARCYIEMAAKARKSKLNTPSLFDALVLAAGRLLKAKVLTGDEHFKNLSETVWLG
jgi:predicted nucleic acid-binding protein